jgi:predicted component of type VI protein secretion system
MSQKTVVYTASSLSLLQRRLDNLIEAGHQIVQIIHTFEPRMALYLDPHIEALVLYEAAETTAEAE